MPTITNHLLLWLALTSMLTGCGLQQPSDTPQRITVTGDMIDAHYALLTVDDLEARGILDGQTAAEQRAYYLEAASVTLERTLTRAELAAAVLDDGGAWWRFISFVNIIWLFASLMIVLALVYIFARYIFPLLRRVPLVAYELLLYAACFGLLYVAWARFEPGIGQYVAMPSLFGLLPLVTWSYGRRIADRTSGKNTFNAHRPLLTMQHTLTLALYVGAAFVFDSELIGFFAVVEALVVIGLMGIPDLIAAALRTTVARAAEEIVLLISLALLAIYIAGEINGVGGTYRLFETAVYLIGTYIYFTVLAVVSSRFYRRGRGRFWFWQVVAVASAVGALFIGTLLQIDTLQENGGTFLLVYLLEKYIEMFNWGRYWAWALLGLGLLLYGVALLVNQYPGYFLFG